MEWAHWILASTSDISAAAIMQSRVLQHQSRSTDGANLWEKCAVASSCRFSHGNWKEMVQRKERILVFGDPLSEERELKDPKAREVMSQQITTQSSVACLQTIINSKGE